MVTQRDVGAGDGGRRGMKKAAAQESRKRVAEAGNERVERGKVKKCEEVLAAHKANIPATKNTVGFAPFFQDVVFRAEGSHTPFLCSRVARLVLRRSTTFAETVLRDSLSHSSFRVEESEPFTCEVWRW